MAEYRKLVAELHFWQQKLEYLSECFGMSNGERDSQMDSAEWNIRMIKKELDEIE
jgi:hypothetical protein